MAGRASLSIHFCIVGFGEADLSLDCETPRVLAEGKPEMRIDETATGLDSTVMIEIVASLEGARVTMQQGVCCLDEYDFENNRWINKDQQPWPLPENLAREWLHGWNRVDQFEALSLLMCPGSSPDSWNGPIK